MNAQIEILNGLIIELNELTAEFKNTEENSVLAYNLRKKITELQKSVNNRLNFIQNNF